MKRRTKNANKRNKLQLRRETVRVLSSENLAKAAGGALYFGGGYNIGGRGNTDDGCHGDTTRCTSFPVHTDGC